MAYNFKNLADVELLDTMPENAKVIVEVDGATKRAPKEDGIGKLVTVEALEEVPEGATVLAEVNGEIKRVPGSGLGGGSMVVNFTMDTSTNTLTADKTYDEVFAELQKGTNVVGLFSAAISESATITMVLNAQIQHMSDTSGNVDGAIDFYGIANNMFMIKLLPDNSIVQSNIKIPTTTSSVTSGSTAVVTSDAVYTYVEGKGYQTADQVNTLISAKVSDTELLLNSSTEGSTKQFKITVDDSGTITATEVTTEA